MARSPESNCSLAATKQDQDTDKGERKYVSESKIKVGF